MKTTNHKDSVLAITLLLLLIQWRFPVKYGLPVIAGSILLCLLWAPFASICHSAWMLLAKGLNAISSFVLLLLVYVVVVLPTAAFSRLFKKSGIKFKSVNPNSNLVVTNKQYSNLDFLHPW